MRSKSLALAGVIVLAAVTAGACRSTPNQRTLGMGSVDNGPGSLEYTRRQLEGTWTLQTFEAADANGQLHPVNASATLTYDAYGNLSVTGRLLDNLPNEQRTNLDPYLHYNGRITIDTTKHEFVLLGASGNVDPALMSIVGTQMVRHYDLTDTQLTITYVDPAGKTAGRTVFKKGS